MDESCSEQIVMYENVQVILDGPYTDEAVFNGRLLIVKEVYGVNIEWQPPSEYNNSPVRKCSPDSENLDWEDIACAPDGYRVYHSSRDAVGFKRTPRLSKGIVVEVADLRSHRRIDLPEKNKIGIIFYLKDGTNIPTFYFDPPEFLSFTEELTKYVVFKPSNTDNRLYLVCDPKEEALAKSFSELQLFGENKSHIVTKFFRDPYSTAMGGFSKVTNMILDYLVYHDEEPTAPPPSSDREVVEMLSEGLSHINICQQEEHGFEVISCVELPRRPIVTRSKPVDKEEWKTYINYIEDGKFRNVEQLLERIFRGGLEDDVRPEAWKFLLGFYSFSSTAKERHDIQREKINEYFRMKMQWRSMTPDQEARFTPFRDKKNLIEKDVSRTDRIHPMFEGDQNTNLMMMFDILVTYCMYNFDLGYVQGMSDLLSPILVVMQSEADAFWCFANWMEEIGANFEMDQQGMKTQLLNLHRLLHFVDPQFCNYLEEHESGNLYFCFRWLLILFKRDFIFDEVMRVWEVLWTGLPCKEFHLLICLAILDTEKTTIMENNYGLTEILKHINDRSYQINLEDTLCKAEAIYLQIKASCHLSDVVRDILGISPPPPQRLDEGGEFSSNQENMPPSGAGIVSLNDESHDNQGNVDYQVLGNGEPQPRNDSHDVEEEYVDLEQQYQISMGNFL